MAAVIQYAGINEELIGDSLTDMGFCAKKKKRNLSHCNPQMSTVLLAMNLVSLHYTEFKCSLYQVCTGSDYFLLLQLPCHPWLPLFKESGFRILDGMLTYLRLQWLDCTDAAQRGYTKPPSWHVNGLSHLTSR